MKKGSGDENAKDGGNLHLVPVPFYCFCLRGQHKLTSSASPFLLFLSARSTQIDVQCQSFSIVFSCFKVDLKKNTVLL